MPEHQMNDYLGRLNVKQQFESFVNLKTVFNIGVDDYNNDNIVSAINVYYYCFTLFLEPKNNTKIKNLDFHDSMPVELIEIHVNTTYIFDAEMLIILHPRTERLYSVLEWGRRVNIDMLDTIETRLRYKQAIVHYKHLDNCYHDSSSKEECYYKCMDEYIRRNSSYTIPYMLISDKLCENYFGNTVHGEIMQKCDNDCNGRKECTKSHFTIDTKSVRKDPRY